MAQRALIWANSIEPALDALILLRDTDGINERKDGFEQAVVSTKIGFPVVIGLPHTMIECWLLVGFKAGNEDETARLASMRSELGFQPCLQGDQLTSANVTDKKNPKRVLSGLCNDSKERMVECCEVTELDFLEANGVSVNLTSFIREVRGKIAPLFGAV